MITQENLAEVLDSLTEAQISKAMDGPNDYVSLEVSCSNACVWVDLEDCEWSEEVEQEIQDNGNLFCDKDQFLQLVKESDTVNPFLLELV
jgi:hypothetical protein